MKHIGTAILNLFAAVHWVADNPIPFTLTLIAGVLLGAIWGTP